MRTKFVVHQSVKKELKNNDSININNSYNNQIDKGIVMPSEISELQGSLQELNNDDFNASTRISGIDLRTRLYNTEIASIVVLDTLVQFKFLPNSISPFTLQKKRLAVSLGGKGRQEIVDIVQGKRENEMQQNSLGAKLKGMFGKSDM